jgi:hypothetical protein
LLTFGLLLFELGSALRPGRRTLEEDDVAGRVEVVRDGGAELGSSCSPRLTM